VFSSTFPWIGALIQVAKERFNVVTSVKVDRGRQRRRLDLISVLANNVVSPNLIRDLRNGYIEVSLKNLLGMSSVRASLGRTLRCRFRRNTERIGSTQFSCEPKMRSSS
jgi:hypothetical protein